jgi:hypothetical protein
VYHVFVYREALHVYATAGGTAARVGATVPTVDPECFVFGLVCYVVVDACHCLYAVDLWLFEL